MNWFAYCNDNPINKTDPDGKNAVAAMQQGGKVLGAIWGGAFIEPTPVGEVVAAVASVGVISWVGYEAVKDLVSNFSTGKDNRSGLPSQGLVTGRVAGAPPVDAGKQGKHVPGHPNYVDGKSSWPAGKTGVRETQEAWKNGRPVKPDASVRVGKSHTGETVKVHQSLPPISRRRPLTPRYAAYLRKEHSRMQAPLGTLDSLPGTGPS